MGDKCNTNFGGAAKRGTNNTFTLQKTSNLKTNIQGTGCAGLILHHALQASSDILLIDTEAYTSIWYGWGN